MAFRIETNFSPKYTVAPGQTQTYETGGTNLVFMGVQTAQPQLHLSISEVYVAENGAKGFVAVANNGSAPIEWLATSVRVYPN